MTRPATDTTATGVERARAFRSQGKNHAISTGSRNPGEARADRSSPIVRPTRLTGSNVPMQTATKSAKPTRPMKDYERRTTACFHRVLDCIAENALVPPVALATTLATELTATTSVIDQYAARQDLAFGNARGAVLDRRICRDMLLSTMEDLSAVAKVLQSPAHPDLGSAMRMEGATSSYMALRNRAQAFHTALVAAKTEFTAYGFAETIDADLLAKITAFEAAGSRKNVHRNSHIGDTAGLRALCAAGRVTVRKLDALYRRAFKNDPVKLAAWKAARRIERAPVSSTSSTTPPPDAGSGGTTTPPSGS